MEIVNRPGYKKRNVAVNSHSGQSLVEVALILPVILLLALGIIELGRFAYISILVGNAARAGAAYGAQNHFTAADQDGIANAAENDFKNNGQDVTLNVTSRPFSCGCDDGNAITPTDCTTGICPIGRKVVSVSVKASGMFNSLFKYPWISNSLTVSRTATIRISI